MAIRVGLNRSISRDCLDAVVECQFAGKTAEEARAELRPTVALYDKNASNQRTILGQLLSVWYRNDPWLQTNAIETCKEISRNEWLPIHYAMLLTAYPVFFDFCSIIGNLIEYQDTIKSTMVKARIIENWGDRTTLKHTLSSSMKTLRDIGIFQAEKASGTYSLVRQEVVDTKQMILLIAAILKTSGRDYMTWEELLHHPVMFSFDVKHVNQGDVVINKDLMLERMGNQTVIRMR